MRRLAVLLLVGSMTLGLLPSPVTGLPPACAAQEGQNRVGIVIRLPDREISRCVGFTGDKISGMAALQRSGFALVTKDFKGQLGVAPCKIEGVGTDTCDYNVGFWGYFHGKPDGSWEESPAGSENYFLENGDVDGWSWKPVAQLRATPPSTPALIEPLCAAGVYIPEGERGPNPILLGILAGWIVLMAIVALYLLDRRIRSRRTV